MSTERGPGITGLVAEYWQTYGGARELFKSPFLYFALLLVPLTAGIWSKEGWWEDVLSILPNLMGISLAAFTLFLGAGSEKFRMVIAGSDSDDVKSGEKPLPSPFVKTASVFLHFLIVQFIAIILAFIAKSLYELPPMRWFVPFNDVATWLFWGGAFFAFLYALSVVLAASFAVFEIVGWFDLYVTETASDEEEDDPVCDGLVRSDDIGEG